MALYVCLYSGLAVVCLSGEGETALFSVSLCDLCNFFLSLDVEFLSCVVSASTSAGNSTRLVSWAEGAINGVSETTVCEGISCGQSLWG